MESGAGGLSDLLVWRGLLRRVGPLGRLYQFNFFGLERGEFKREHNLMAGNPLPLPTTVPVNPSGEMIAPTPSATPSTPAPLAFTPANLAYGWSPSGVAYTGIPTPPGAPGPSDANSPYTADQYAKIAQPSNLAPLMGGDTGSGR